MKQRRKAGDEARERMPLSGEFNNLEHELDGLKDQFEEEVCARYDLLRQVSEASLEADMWRQEYEQEGVAKAWELEMVKTKLQARLVEAQNTVEQMQAKLAQIDGAR